jgi:hypothetical protein
MLGGLCAIFGVVTSIAVGKDWYEVLTLVDATEFGRAYVGGLGILFGGILIALLNLVRRFLENRKRAAD